MLRVGPRFGLVANRGLRWHRGAERGGMPSFTPVFGVVGFWIVFLVEGWVLLRMVGGDVEVYSIFELYGYCINR